MMTEQTCSIINVPQVRDSCARAQYGVLGGQKKTLELFPPYWQPFPLDEHTVLYSLISLSFSLGGGEGRGSGAPPPEYAPGDISFCKSYTVPWALGPLYYFTS